MTAGVVPVFTHPDCLAHDPGPGHPEQPDRLRRVLARLERHPDAALHEAAPASLDPIRAVHPDAHLDAIRSGCAAGGLLFPDTVVGPGSWDAMLGAVGAVLAAVDSALAGRPAFAAVRPPGHHALADRGMGFCLVNNVVVAARAAQRAGRGRVLIVDWDVHHGNGTQALVERDPTVRFVSLHQWPWYPGTGAASERGVGNVFNVPRPPGLPRARYVADLWDAVERATEAWPPDVVLISAGFDAMAGDPLGGFTLEPADYAELTTRLRRRCPAAALAGMLEGGYAPARVAEGVAAHVSALA